MKLSVLSLIFHTTKVQKKAIQNKHTRLYYNYIDNFQTKIHF